MEQSYKFNIYKKLKQFFIKKGKTQKANNIINKALLSISRENKLTLSYILLFVFNKLNSFFEIRKLYLRRRLNVIPFAANKKRRVYLVIKRIREVLLLDKRKKPISAKLQNEIFNIFLREKLSSSIKLKKADISKVFSYRSNIHFRW